MHTFLARRGLLVLAALLCCLAGCHSDSGEAKLTPQDVNRLPASVKNSNLPDAAKQSLAEELRKRELKPGQANGQGQ